MTNRVSITILALALSACGGDSPSAPTRTAPPVAGSYSGSVTITYPQLARTVNCPASTTVNQNGFSLSIAPMVFGGLCGITLPVGNTEIDANGSILGNSSGTLTEPSCGVYSYVASGGFFGREFRFSMAYTSATCVNFNISGVLTR